MSKLEVKNLNKSFNNGQTKHIVLNNLNLSVLAGEYVSLLGPSGCGKTTLLSIMAGFQKADTGAVLINDCEVAKPGPDRAFVFQNYALFPWMTLKENILYPMKRQRIDWQEREAILKQLLVMAHLEGKENLYPHQLSGGMKQRTAVIRALACRPEVLLMDEPLGAVDFQMRQSLQEELEQIFLQDQATVIMVTHDVEEAVFMSDRVIVMSPHEGQIIEDLAIKLPRPRERRSQQFNEYRLNLMKLLQANKPQDETGMPKRKVV
ncbi:MAG: ABC transporter ATP-binding protein SaoA [Syntrophomonas sp.]